jgi:hypothetical protein
VIAAGFAEHITKLSAPRSTTRSVRRNVFNVKGGEVVLRPETAGSSRPLRESISRIGSRLGAAKGKQGRQLLFPFDLAKVLRKL